MPLLASSHADTRKYDRGLTNLLYDELHWLDVPERVQYKLCATVHRCLQHKSPHYMEDCCILTTDTARRQQLRSAGCHHLLVPRYRRFIFGRRAFSVAGPNSLPDYLRDLTRSVEFSSRSENFSFLALLAYAHQGLSDYALYKSTIDTDIDIDLCRPDE